MKIIKRGRKPERRLYRGECDACGTLVEAEHRELEEVEEKSGAWLAMECPVCKEEDQLIHFHPYTKPMKPKPKESR